LEFMPAAITPGRVVRSQIRGGTMKREIRRGSTRGSRLAKGTAVAVVVALAMSAAAPAKDQSYDGPIFDSKGSVEFSLEREKGHLYVKHFRVDKLPYTCPDGSSKTTDFRIGRMKVHRHKFDGYTMFGDFRGDEYAEVEGRLRPHGRARGYVYYEDGFDGLTVCESGQARWRASP
jgi:hypothetical protein